MESAKRVDLTYLRSFTLNNKDSLLKYIRMFLETAPPLLRSIQAAAEASDSAALYTALHTLKPQLQIMGIADAHRIVETTEAQVRANNMVNDQTLEAINNINEELSAAIIELEAIKSELA